MKKTLISTATIIVLSLTANMSFAEEGGTKKLNPWQDCGLGAMVFPDNGVAAAISNVIWDLGTTAVTSASASEDNCASSKATTARFVTESYMNIEEDVAKGQGQHLTAMLNLMGCESEQQAEVVSTIRSEFSDEFVSDSFASLNNVQKAERLFNISEDASALVCKAV